MCGPIKIGEAQVKFLGIGIGNTKRYTSGSKARGACVLAQLVIVIVGGLEKTQSLTRRVAGSNLSLSTYRRQNLPTRPEADEP